MPDYLSARPIGCVNDDFIRCRLDLRAATADEATNFTGVCVAQHLHGAVVGQVGRFGSAEAHAGEDAAKLIARLPGIRTRCRLTVVGRNTEGRFECDLSVYNAAPDEEAISRRGNHVRTWDDDAKRAVLTEDQLVEICVVTNPHRRAITHDIDICG